jgi:DHA1 family L-arabinose/isopropyl-beta-D-thiogalactopyranoside export protein-like MFS transporter/DHA1 family inner membrane transport protein
MRTDTGSIVDGLATAGPRPATSSRRANGALVALSVTAFCFVTTEILPIGLLATIAADLHRSPSQVGLLVTGYAVVVAVAAFPLTLVTRHIPRRWLLAGTLGFFAAATVASALAPNYPLLLAARMLIALTQAVFWSVANSTATGLFPPAVRGRIVARLGIGNSLAPVLGVPAGTWLGQQVGWRWAFLVMGGIGLAVCLSLLIVMPTIAPKDAGAARGAAPDTRRFAVLLVGTALGVTGFLTAFTYITPYLLDVTGFAASSLSPLLFASGVAGLAGTVIVGAFLDRYPRSALIVPLTLISAGLLGLYAFGTVKLLAVVLLSTIGLAYSALAVAVGGRTLQIAPGNTDLAAAGTNAAFNVGIASGSLLGGTLIGSTGTRSIPLVGGFLAGSALAVLAAESILVRPGRLCNEPAHRIH